MNNSYGDYLFVERRRMLRLAQQLGLHVHFEETWLTGFQIYIVEQWVVDRTSFCNTVKVFTGDSSHKIKVCSVSLAPDVDNTNLPREAEKLLSDMDLKGLAKPKMTKLGTIMVSNLTNFPSSLNIVLVPDGDYEEHITECYVNLNLRRLRCTGRSAFSLNPPNNAQKDKFRQLYSTSEHINFQYSVMELVTLAQIALNLFGHFRSSWIDGLLCDATLEALRSFYNEQGSFEFPELDEVWLDPRLLAALLSKLVDCRQKLSSLGYQVCKDPFTERETFRNNVASFQKSIKVNISKSLDNVTIKMLNELYSKSSPQSSLRVHKVLMSKIEDFSGMSNTPIEQETSNLNNFIRSINIDRLKYLWQGKGRPSQNSDVDNIHPPVDWLPDGREIGRNLLRGVSVRTTKAGGTIREGVGMIMNVAGSLSDLKQRTDKRPGSGDRMIQSIAQEPQSSVNPNFKEEPAASPKSHTSDDAKDIAPSLGADRPTSHVKLPSLFGERRRRKAVRFTRKSSILAESITNGADGADGMRSHEMNSVLVLRRSNSVNGTSFAPLSQTRRPSMQRFHTFTGYSDLELLEWINHPPQIMFCDLQTFSLLEELRRREGDLQETVFRLEKLSATYDQKTDLLARAYGDREEEFKTTREAAMDMLARQSEQESTVKQASLRTSKLQYELSVMEDKLREVEEYVDNFNQKIQQLESRLPPSQKSMQTLLIVRNYFKHYWDKLFKPSKSNGAR
ncbi:uncharacterized protein VTP21DRAFT_5118 [Calcarisporiella thermophila]|uniref:uncharacterized protein n=1 Tax=Calcarisporiella thermophila TaxID=911321 RepID=UPI0037426777